MYKYAIVGSRDFPRLDLVETYIRKNIVSKSDLWEYGNDEWSENYKTPLCELVSGAGGKVDNEVAKIARKYKIPLKEFPAQWRAGGSYNNRAGIERNKLIAEYADYVIAFYDPCVNYQRSGTLSTCQFAAQLGKPVRIFTGIEDNL